MDECVYGCRPMYVHLCMHQCNMRARARVCVCVCYGIHSYILSLKY